MGKPDNAYQAIKIEVNQVRTGRLLEIYGVQFPSGIVRAGTREYVIRNASYAGGATELMVVHNDRQAPMGLITRAEVL